MTVLRPLTRKVSISSSNLQYLLNGMYTFRSSPIAVLHHKSRKIKFQLPETVSVLHCPHVHFYAQPETQAQFPVSNGAQKLQPCFSTLASYLFVSRALYPPTCRASRFGKLLVVTRKCSTGDTRRAALLSSSVNNSGLSQSLTPHSSQPLTYYLSCNTPQCHITPCNFF
ncbi:hypothetical protein J6590_007564 [Homalodisca vitripennis]|nr:hypothetical protein J6590_007564 [Homalodisca vitripennis]